MFNFETSARFPVLVRVYTDAGEIFEHLARSMRAAQGWFAHCMTEGYWYGKPQRIVYEVYKGYRWE